MWISDVIKGMLKIITVRDLGMLELKIVNQAASCLNETRVIRVDAHDNWIRSNFIYCLFMP